MLTTTIKNPIQHIIIVLHINCIKAIYENKLSIYSEPTIIRQCLSIKDLMIILDDSGFSFLIEIFFKVLCNISICPPI